MKIKFMLVIGIMYFLSGCSSQIPKLGVQSDLGTISKSKIFTSFNHGYVHRIKYGDYNNSPGNEIMILGRFGVYVLSYNNQEFLSQIVPKDTSNRTVDFGLSPDIVRTENKTFYIMRGGGGFGSVGLLNDAGRIIWKFQPDLGGLSPRKMIHADLNNDKIPEFYVADYEGFYCLDLNGKITWKDKGKFYDIENLNNEKILCLNRDSELITINSQGKTINNIKLPENIGYFVPINWPNGQNILAGPFGGEIKVFDLNGKQLFQFKNNSFSSYHAPQAVSVKFEKDQPHYLAVLAHSSSRVKRSQLSIFTNTGELVYQEIINDTRGIISIPEFNHEVLLVGDANKGLIKYKFLSKNSN